MYLRKYPKGKKSDREDDDYLDSQRKLKKINEIISKTQDDEDFVKEKVEIKLPYKEDFFNRRRL